MGAKGGEDAIKALRPVQLVSTPSYYVGPVRNAALANGHEPCDRHRAGRDVLPPVLLKAAAPVTHGK